MREKIENQQFDKERALYHLMHTDVENCIFAGPQDGESVLKESRDIIVNECDFSLRYPLWHVKGFQMNHSTMDELTRAAIWYAINGEINDSELSGIKAVRECSNISINHSSIHSPEFGWKSSYITLKDSDIQSEYLFFESDHVKLDRVEMKGKYSFQYMNHLEINDSVLDTKDAFWHSKNVTVRNSIVKGEYLGWFSEGLTLINCKISGTQPLCYCKNLRLENCTMEETDLSFEYSDVEADIHSTVISIKNPRSGHIVVDDVGEVIWEEPVMECAGRVIRRYDLLKYEIVPMVPEEYPLLEDYLYDAIFIPEGVTPPPRSILNAKELRVYVDGFGEEKDDIAYVAKVDGQVVGAVWVRIMDDFGNVDSQTPSFAISIKKDYRGHGIGTALMRQMLFTLSERGYQKTSLAVQQANYAYKMYKKVGFDVVEERGDEYIMVHHFCD